ncbi:transcriptional regulator, MarR family protein [Polaribacter irgensii 23-P]|uniref:Transcriptional regulator, MarR family protein n=1 Tax=Polaribacter irgensii 23-P TaxID=313594 RepID=A4C0R9_9FLAO|nr:GNAT family N-acetyltransferase [Polaribacter irgensii]EAR13012.1 transcriptional regulator, MarR family protein [Polaribacter irgensii 23-P]
MKALEIKKYEEHYQQQFKEISLEWLHAYGLYEEADADLIENPKKYIHAGGFIFLAHYTQKVVGTVSLIPSENNTFEIMKLGVLEGYKGLGIGRTLMQVCIDICKEKKAHRITLETSSKLKNAIQLYEKLGFLHVEITDSCYESADVKMILNLK